MKRLLINFLFLLCVFGVSVSIISAQSNEETTLKPPEWILGSWNNSANSDTRRFETFTFTKNEINVYRGFVKNAESLYLSEKFEGYKIKQTVESSLFRVEFSKDDKEYIYEFKLCETDTCKSFSRKALTYSISENGKIIAEHSESINLVLFKRELNK